MRVVNGLSGIPHEAQGAVLAIGNFDGMHRGHQALLKTALATAKTHGAPGGAILFEPHPREFFHPEEPHFRLTPLQEKLRILSCLGLDLAIVIPFDRDFANLDADVFIKSVLVDRLKVRRVIIGYDFFFGRGRVGSPETLRKAGTAHGFGVTIVEPVAEDGEVFSSTAIRLKLAQGDVAGAAHALGRWWRITGPVVDGTQRGMGLGFPTANIPLSKGTALAHGIYAVRAHLDLGRHDGAAYLGTRPTFDDGMPVLEIFLFDFKGDLYGQEMSIEFIGFIRPDRKFDRSDDLIAQMYGDCAQARDVLASAPHTPP